MHAERGEGYVYRLIALQEFIDTTALGYALSKAMAAKQQELVSVFLKKLSLFYSNILFWKK